MTIAVSDKITPRPVWRRHLRRTVQNISPMPPPTEEEKYDAIRVLEDPWNAGESGLWREAHLIFAEASE